MIPESWLKEAHDRAARASFRVGEDGVWTPRVKVTTTPMTVDAVFQGEERWLRLAWFQNGRVRRKLVSRAALSTKGRVLDLGVLGIDIGPHNAKRVAAYLLQLEAQGDLPEYPIQPSMGWDEDLTAFVLGNWTIREEGSIPSDPTITVPRPEAIHLEPHSLPFDLLAEEEGKWDGWVKGANLAGKYPRLALAMYAALVPALQRALNLPVFAVQWVGPPSTGKSTCVALGASLWGNPDPMSDHSFIRLWSAPAPQLDATAAILRDLPMCMDDLRTQVSLHPLKMEGLLSGQAVGTLRKRWNTVVLSSGPDGLESQAGHEALGGRSLTLWGPPLGKQDKDTARDVATIRASILSNFGHLGPRFLQVFLKAKPDWPRWAQAYQALSARFAMDAIGQGGMAGACSAYVAAIAVAAEVLHTMVPELTFDPQPTVQDLWTWLRTNGARTAKATLALGHVLDWVAQFPTRFINTKRLQSERVPKGGWAGLFDDAGRTWIVVGLVNDLLASGSFDSDQVYRDWIQQGIIQSHQGKVWRTIMLGGRSARCVGFLPPEPSHPGSHYERQS